VFKDPLSNTLLKGSSWAGTLSALPFTLGIVMLVCPPRCSGTAGTTGPALGDGRATTCFSVGFLISAAGVALGQYWLVVVGYGFVGRIGLGIGYISPVSTLIKWFPDRPAWPPGSPSWASAAAR